MSILPRQSLLGTLEIIDVFDVFDFPRLFLATNTIGSQFLVLSVAEEPTALTWLYLPISSDRLSLLKATRLTLRTAFAEPEDRLVLVRVSQDGSSNIEWLGSAPLEWLPAEGEYLAHQTALPVLGATDTARERAHRHWRDVVEIAFYFPTYTGTSAPLRPLGEVYSSFQQAIDVLAISRVTTVAPRGALSPELLEHTQLELAGHFEGSYGSVVTARTLSDLFGKSLVSEGIAILSRLATLSSTPQQFHQEVRELGPRAANRLRVFYESLDTSKAVAEFRWAAPAPDSWGSFLLSREIVVATLSMLTSLESAEAETISLRCTLIGVNIRTKSYEIVSPTDRKRYTGRVADEALPQIAHATINESYDATIKVLIDISTSTGEERARYILTALNPSLPGSR